MRIVGIDLGQRTGYAILDTKGARVTSDTVNLGKRSGSSLSSFLDILSAVLSGATVVAYEKVRRHRGVQAAHAYGSYEGCLLLACYSVGIPADNVYPVPVGQIKKVATGEGRAQKEHMEAAAWKRWNYMPDDDNEADALWVAESVRLRLVNERTILSTI